MKLSELFEAKSDVKSLKEKLKEMESASSVPNLSISQADIRLLETNFKEEKRLLLAELVSEKNAHQQTKQQLREENMRREELELEKKKQLEELDNTGKIFM